MLLLLLRCVWRMRGRESQLPPLRAVREPAAAVLIVVAVIIALASVTLAAHVVVANILKRRPLEWVFHGQAAMARSGCCYCC